MLKRYGLCVGIAFGAASAALALCALIAVRLPDPRGAVGALGLAAYLFGALAAGLSAALICSDQPLISAALCGAAYTLPIAVISLFFRDGATRPFWQSAIVYAVGLLISCAIGLVRSRQGHSAHSTRKNMMKKMRRRA